MKKLTTIIFTVWAMNSHAQNEKQAHISVVQGVSTEGKESRNTDYFFSFNLFSGVVHSINGAEIGTLYNQNDGNMMGFQTSGLVNYTKGAVKGYQVAGISNISGNVVGCQNAGISNHAKNVSGIQISGIFNQAKTLRGLQIGLINVAETVEKGGGIGLVNLYKNGGYREVELSVADYQNIGLSFKSGTKRIYSIMNAGYNFTPQALFSTGIGLGQIYQLKRNTFFKPEIIWYNYVTDDFKFSKTTQSAHLKLGFMQKVGNVGITLSPSIYYAGIPKNLEGALTEISELKYFSQTDKGRWGYGLSLGIAILK
ncbi:hypothetical protein EGI22_04830 [Lacihabitans sp. LS3-19]|uniref:hypothetical protein n=1 Tax=Lacihabitans sp. LS3-19 TaxID=2487335 RepID=UPI0020CF1F46|nr:hypothetical protein [Lacihabitans sp. LS3-19]MCP9767224.1 hypothetical protein [Lacihabitans sp. LS3-19]